MTRERRLADYQERLENTGFSYATGFRDNLRPCLHYCRQCGNSFNLVPKKVKQGISCTYCFPVAGREDGAAHLYIMVSDGYPCKLKVGFSRYMSQRTAALKARTPFNFRAFAIKTMTVARARQLEMQLHHRLARHRVQQGRFDGSSEWFHLNDEVAQLLDQLHFDFISDKVFSVATLRLTKKRKQQ